MPHTFDAFRRCGGLVLAAALTLSFAGSSLSHAAGADLLLADCMRRLVVSEGPEGRFIALQSQTVQAKRQELEAELKRIIRSDLGRRARAFHLQAVHVEAHGWRINLLLQTRNGRVRDLRAERDGLLDLNPILGGLRSDLTRLIVNQILQLFGTRTSDSAMVILIERNAFEERIQAIRRLAVSSTWSASHSDLLSLAMDLPQPIVFVLGKGEQRRTHGFELRPLSGRLTVGAPAEIRAEDYFAYVLRPRVRSEGSSSSGDAAGAYTMDSVPAQRVSDRDFDPSTYEATSGQGSGGSGSSSSDGDSGSDGGGD